MKRAHHIIGTKAQKYSVHVNNKITNRKESTQFCVFAFFFVLVVVCARESFSHKTDRIWNIRECRLESIAFSCEGFYASSLSATIRPSSVNVRACYWIEVGTLNSSFAEQNVANGSM